MTEACEGNKSLNMNEGNRSTLGDLVDKRKGNKAKESFYEWLEPAHKACQISLSDHVLVVACNAGICWLYATNKLVTVVTPRL